jgi:polyphosphate kinase 2 (PPK2 family)
LKFFLRISKEEQLARFAERLHDPARNWKISEADYSERALWDDYVEAYEDAIAATSMDEAPWYVVPDNHKWFRNFTTRRRFHGGARHVVSKACRRSCRYPQEVPRSSCDKLKNVRRA